MGKITVKHYLNKSTAKKALSGDARQQVYVQVTVKRQVNRKRSQVDDLFDWNGPEYGLTQKELEDALNDNTSVWGKALFLERKIIEDVITYLDPVSKEDFTLANFSEVFHLATYTVFKLIEDKGKHHLEVGMRDQWPEVYNIIDRRKPLLELLDGLTLLASNNDTFNQSVLMDKDLCIAKLLIEQFYEYAEALPRDINNHSEYLSHTAFYWFTNNMTNKYINYLLRKRTIKVDQVNSLVEFFEIIGKIILSKIELLSRKK
jgi:hypothetical protein